MQIIIIIKKKAHTILCCKSLPDFVAAATVKI